MENQIKIIEDLSLNAWPSHQIQLYDGWILRFSYFYTHRTNCIEQIGTSSIPLIDKLDYCEEIYEKWGTPTIYKITPLLDSSFDQKLAERGYHIAHKTEVLTLDLDQNRTASEDCSVELSDTITPEWLSALFSMKGTVNKIHRRIVPSMYAAIPKDVIVASVRRNGRIVGTGLCILDRDYAGLYAIHVDEEFRRCHIARSLCRSLLNAAASRGTVSAYLQVVAGNTAAKNLYLSLGFRELYTYWFRQEYPVSSWENQPTET